MLEALLAFLMPTFAHGKKMEWHFPQMDKLATAQAQTACYNNPSLKSVMKEYSSSNKKFPSIQVEVVGTEEKAETMTSVHNYRVDQALENYQITNNNGQLLFIAPEAPSVEKDGKFNPIGPVIPPPLTDNETVEELIKTWDSLLLKNKLPSKEQICPAINIFNMKTIDKPLKLFFFKMEAKDQTMARLRDILAAALLSRLPEPFSSYRSQERMMEVLATSGDISDKMGRAELLQKAANLIRVTGISRKSVNPWNQLAAFGRAVADKMWRWLKKLAEDPFQIPEDMIFYPIAARRPPLAYGDGNARLFRQAYSNPPSLILVKKSGPVIPVLMEVEKLKVYLLPETINTHSDFMTVNLQIATALKHAAFGTTEEYSELKEAMRKDDRETAYKIWAAVICRIKKWQKEGDHAVFINPKLTSFLARRAAKTISPFVEEIKDKRLGQIMKSWAIRFGNEEVNTTATHFKKPTKLNTLLTSWKSFPGQDGKISEPIFKPNVKE